MKPWIALAVAAMIATACSSRGGEDPFERSRTDSRSADSNQRRRGAGQMVATCCFPELLDADNRHRTKERVPEACAEVKRLLETERDPLVLEQLVTPAHVACFRQFPPAVTASMCQSGCDPALRTQLLAMLAELHPSPEGVRVIRAALGDPDEAVRASAERAMATLGEIELHSLVEVLASSDAIARRAAARGFYLAVNDGAPLDISVLGPALERATRDSDPDVAREASRAMTAYLGWGGASPDEAVISVMKRPNKEQVARLLAVRSFSCKTIAAGKALQTLAADDNPRVAAAAKDAITLREERCPRLPG